MVVLLDFKQFNAEFAFVHKKYVNSVCPPKGDMRKPKKIGNSKFCIFNFKFEVLSIWITRLKHRLLKGFEEPLPSQFYAVYLTVLISG